MVGSGYSYSLSVFGPESGMAAGHYSREEILKFLDLDSKEVRSGPPRVPRMNRSRIYRSNESLVLRVT